MWTSLRRGLRRIRTGPRELTIPASLILIEPARSVIVDKISVNKMYPYERRRRRPGPSLGDDEARSGGDEAQPGGDKARPGGDEARSGGDEARSGGFTRDRPF